MTDEELGQLLEDIESDRVERKESGADGDKIRQVICAFANDLANHDQAGVTLCWGKRCGRSCRLDRYGSNAPGTRIHAWRRQHSALPVT